MIGLDYRVRREYLMNYLPQPDIRFYERIDKYCHYYNYNVYEGSNMKYT